MRVKDIDGSVVPGLIKNSAGTIVVNSTVEYEKYKREIAAAAELNSLKAELDEIKSLLKILVLNNTKGT